MEGPVRGSVRGAEGGWACGGGGGELYEGLDGGRACEGDEGLEGWRACGGGGGGCEGLDGGRACGCV